MITKVEIENGRPKGYETVKEFAEELGVNDVTIRMWIYRGVLESLKIGSDNWIKIGTERPTVQKKKKVLQNKNNKYAESYIDYVKKETEKIIESHGGLRKAAMDIKLDPAVLSKWRNGKLIPSPTTFSRYVGKELVICVEELG